jgi:hypothetical protein
MNAGVLAGFFAGGAASGLLLFFAMRPAAQQPPAPATAAAEEAISSRPDSGWETPAPVAAVAKVAVSRPMTRPAPAAAPRSPAGEAPAAVTAAKPEAPAAAAEEAAKSVEPEYKSNPTLDHVRAQPVPPPPDENAGRAPASGPAPARQPNTVTLKDGTLFKVRLAETLSSERHANGDTFWATLDEPLAADGFVIAERGARVEGKVINAVRAGRVKGTAELSLQLTRLRTSDGQDVAIQTATFTKEGPKSVKDDAMKVAIGSAIGAAIGAIGGGGRGAAIGAATGGAAGGGYVLTQRGKPAELPVETRLTFRLEVPVTLTERVR